MQLDKLNEGKKLKYIFRVCGAKWCRSEGVLMFGLIFRPAAGKLI
jgi:hypothetical protein